MALSASKGFSVLCVYLLATASTHAQERPAWESSLDLQSNSLYSEREPLGHSELRWVKFTIVERDGESALYFQNSRTYLFHYDFAVEHIPEFSGLSRSEFNARTLFNTSREALVGAVLVRLNGFDLEPDAFAIELVAQDPLPKETVAEAYALVIAAIAAPAELPHFYFPTYEQRDAALAARAWLAAQGIDVGDIELWSGANVAYASGWAIGPLKRFTADTVHAAYAQGLLLSSDILWIDRVPAELPHVAGIICETPATPNSHVAILARSWNIPFAHRSATAMAKFAGHADPVVFRTDTGDGFIDLRTLDPNIDAALLEEILALKKPPSLDLPAMEPAGVLWRSTDDLGPDDIVTVGGKAAHFGLLRDALPERSPEAIAFTFDLWERFLNQHLALRGRSLREEIESRLSVFNSWPVDAGQLQTALAGIRAIITQEAQFAAEDQAAILDALSGFDPERKIRFRSSTNVEDSESFTGAGLYDSYSGCLLDDLDADASGPSRCDPSDAEERGVFRALRKVYASFYNDNAFAERLRHGVDVSRVGMAVLVHHSFPDEIELANGVATLEPILSSEDAPTYFVVTIVSQVGAVSVTNPEGGATPEVMEATSNGSWVSSFYTRQRSSLLRLGESTVLGDQAEYDELLQMMLAVRLEWGRVRPDKSLTGLEFEFKKTAPGNDLIIKQVRPLPRLPAPEDRMYLLAGSQRLEVPQGENNNVIAIHRNKAIVDLHVPSQRLPSLGSTSPSPLDHVTLLRAVDGSVLEHNSDSAALPDAHHSVEEDTYSATLRSRTAWREDVAGLTAERSILLRYPKPRPAFPIFTLDAFQAFLETSYPHQPEPWDLFPGGLFPEPDPADPASELLRLSPVNSTDAPAANALLQERTFAEYGVTVETAFYWPPYPTGAVAGYTAPLHAWKETTITGLTNEPFTLTGWFAQTYRPDHHNFGESFIFEPRLDSSLSEATRAELETLDVHWIVIGTSPNFPGLHYLGADRVLRRLAGTDPLVPWFGSLEYPGGDWRRSAWFGDFEAAAFPDIAHAQHQWLHVAGSGSDNLWIWHYGNDLGWTWTSRHVYPWFFSFNDYDWILYLKGTSAPQWFFHYNNRLWLTHE